MPSERMALPAIGRSLETQERYRKHIEDKIRRGDCSCDLCTNVERQRRENTYPMIGSRAIILTNRSFTLLENDFPYSVYDGQRVTGHHLLVPRRHIDDNGITSDRNLRYDYADARAELLDLTGDYYTLVMTRTSANHASSIPGHAHGHMMRTVGVLLEQYFSLDKGINRYRFNR